ncbi:uncharacterized protein [Halyomorpha halys]|uniref:uncharacterized protein n=1 Tax=Halyomorpha halys TaxID=286706 RepID=UPI0034D2BB6E
MDYGSFVYGSARYQVLAKLDTIHHAGIRIATGAFRTSPILSLCAESGQLPLLFRRLKLAIGYTSKLYPQTEHPTHKYIFNGKFSNIFQVKRNSTLPLSEKIASTISFLKTSKINQSENDHPPWTHQRPKTILELSKYLKHNTEHSRYKAHFSRLIQNMPTVFTIFTDGSKSEQSTALAFVIKNCTHKIKLHKLCDIFIAELNAIAAALYFCLSSIQNNIIIVTDSLSSLKAIDYMYPKHHKISKIHYYLTTLVNLGISVQLMWVPSHAGITGNELADRAAREALTQPGRGKVVLTPTEMSRSLIREITDGLQFMWNESPASKLKTIKKEVRPWSTSSRKCRRVEVVLTRLRIGHTRLTHSYLITKEAQPKCKH